MKRLLIPLLLTLFITVGLFGQQDLADIPTNKASGSDSLYDWELNRIVLYLQNIIDSLNALGGVDMDTAATKAAAALGDRLEVGVAASTYEPLLVNEAGLYSALSDVTQFVEAGDNATLLNGTNWRLLYIDGSGNVVELALGSAGKVLTTGGVSSAPTWETPAALDSTADIYTATDSLYATIIKAVTGDTTHMWSVVKIDCSIVINEINMGDDTDYKLGGASLESVLDHDALANFAANEHFTQAAIVATGTIASGTWEGTAIADAYVANDITASNYLPLAAARDSANVAIQNFKETLWSGSIDSSIIKTADTLFLTYASSNWTIDTVVIHCT